MDISENYTSVMLDEVQRAYWGQKGVTLHPIVVYYRNNCGELCHQRYVTVPITQLLIKSYHHRVQHMG